MDGRDSQVLSNNASSLYLEERKERNVLKITDENVEEWSKFFNNNQSLLKESLQSVSGIDLSHYQKEIDFYTTEDEWLQEIINVMDDKDDKLPSIYHDIRNNEFYSYFIPFFNLAYSKLKITIDIRLINDQILKKILTMLHSKMFEKSIKTLVYEFNMSQDEHLTITSKVKIPTVKTHSPKTPSIPFFEKYPVLMRLLYQDVIKNVAHFVEIFQRFHKDKLKIKNALNLPDDDLYVSDIHFDQGDSHQNGRSVAILEVNQSNHIVYKPRSLESDVRYNEVLDWMSSGISTEYGLYTPFVINEDNYGWVEFIDHKPCHSMEEITSFYIRMGIHIAILYSLNATDFHHENIIAHGEHPVLIDLESLFQSNIFDNNYSNSAVDRAMELLESSVQSTGILPLLLYHRNDLTKEGVDISGLGGKKQQLPFQGSKLSIGREDMHFYQDTLYLEEEKNRPYYLDEKIEMVDYLIDIKQGFSMAYDYIAKNKQSYIMLIESFKDTALRMILRPTYKYGELLRSSYHPSVLMNGLDRDVLLHRLFLSTLDVPKLTGSSYYEKKDMLNGDIPYFITYPNSLHLKSSEGKVIKNFYNQTALSQSMNKVKNMNDMDKKQQLQVIQNSILAANADYEADVENINPYFVSKKKISKDQILNEAEKIGDYLIDSAIEGFQSNERELTWISTVLEGQNEVVWKISPIGYDLYNGNSGISILFAYLYSLTQKEKYKRACYEVIAPLRKEVAKIKYNEEWSIGAYSGAGGYLYSLFQVALICNDEELLKEVESNIPEIIKLIPEDNIYDIIGGSAGTLMVLLEIYESTHSQIALEGAIQCGEHLIRNFTDEGDVCGWISPWETAPLTGFSHGNSGVVTALYRLYTVWPHIDIPYIVDKALAYERTFYNETKGNWDSPNKDTTGLAWCHGAPGILLGRVLLKKYGFKDSHINEEIEIALNTTIDHSFGNNRTFCHGDFGQLEILRQTAVQLDSHSLYILVENIFSQVFDILQKQDIRKGANQGTESISLMAGLAGNAYGLLQYYEPQIVTNLLSLELHNNKGE